MKAEILLDAMTYIDEELIAGAENIFYKRKPKARRKSFIAAAFVSFALISGSTIGYSIGAFDGILQYFGGNADYYVDKIITDDLYAADDNVEMRIHGVTVNEDNMHLLVSLNGKSASGKKELEESGLTVREYIEVFTINADDTLTKCSPVTVGTLTQTNLNGIQPITKIEDVQMTFSVDSKVEGNIIRLCFRNLCIDFDLTEHRFETMFLSPENIEMSEVKDVKMSAVGFSFTMQNMEFHNLELTLIKSDGSVYDKSSGKIGYHCGTDYENDSVGYVAGIWCEGSPVNNAVLDLEKFCGLEINGEKFYYREPLK